MEWRTGHRRTRATPVRSAARPAGRGPEVGAACGQLAAEQAGEPAGPTIARRRELLVAASTAALRGERSAEPPPAGLGVAPKPGRARPNAPDTARQGAAPAVSRGAPDATRRGARPAPSRPSPRRSSGTTPRGSR